MEGSGPPPIGFGGKERRKGKEKRSRSEGKKREKEEREGYREGKSLRGAFG